VVLVGQQREAERVLVMEALQLGRRVGIDAEHRRARGGRVGAMVAHAAGLRGAAGRLGLGVEVHDHRLPAEVGQPHRPPVLVGQLEVGREFSRLWHRRDATR